ncbi:substrate-binding periplasmic protein [Desulfovibrio psychrotolerans]|uniref:ABC transporter substrate-binding protein n=1 Tax=Desulfovibrio psychrotolerans TaxID=415242 RepID=A0A7J0BW08_9BACT|nr:transporter substrate-binding domain-containing protein [Desulfovibrio psychrotolerans]GFM37897.1 ABC transporter substrate-binding protein [Desulfovibrio psychrotolerans]
MTVTRICSALLLAIILVLSVVAPAAAQKNRNAAVRIVMCEWVPYTTATLPDSGALAEIAKIALQLQGLEAQFTIVPWARAVSMMQQGETDALLPVYMSGNNLKRYHLSESVLDVDSVFMRLKEVEIPYTTPQNLQGWRIGTVQHTSYKKNLADLGIFLVEEVPHEIQNYRKLVAGRIDMMLDTRETLERMLDSLPAEERHEVVFMDPPLHTKSLHMAFAPTSRGRQLRNIFNEGMNAVRSKGVYDAVLDKHDVVRSTGTAVRQLD